MHLPVIIEETSRFSCGGCGDCCSQPWRTQIEADTAAALDRHDWSKYPGLVGRRFYHPPADGRAGYFDLAKGEGTRCIFLDADNRCIIHKEMGSAAKPGMCRLFPYLPSVTLNSQRVSLNFGCPSVQAAHGPTLAEQAADIQATVTPMPPAVDPNAMILFDATRVMTQAQYEAFVDRAMTLFAEDGVDDLWTCFARLVALSIGVAIQIDQAGGGRSDELTQLLRDGAALPQTASIPAPVSFERPSDAPQSVRLLFATTLYPDTVPADTLSHLGLMKRLTMVPRLMSLANLSGGYASRLLGRNVRVDAVMRHAISPQLDAGSTRLLARYYRSRFWQRLLVGTRLPIVGGIHQHVLDLNAIVFFARAEAQHAGAESISEPMIRRALSMVEFHIANQARLYHHALRTWLLSMLQDPAIALMSLRLMALRRPVPQTSQEPVESCVASASI